MAVKYSFNAFGLISNLTDKIVTESFPTTINNSLLLSNSIVPDNSGFPIFLLQLERWTRKALAGSPVCREYPMLLLQHLGSRNIPTNGNLCYEADFSLYFIEDKDCKWCQDLRGRSRGEIESDARNYLLSFYQAISAARVFSLQVPPHLQQFSAAQNGIVEIAATNTIIAQLSSQGWQNATIAPQPCSICITPISGEQYLTIVPEVFTDFSDVYISAIQFSLKCLNNNIEVSNEMPDVAMCNSGRLCC